MQDDSFESDFDLGDEFDPLAEDELDIKSDEIDDDDPDDIIDMPVIPNMPEGVVRKGMFDADSYDDPHTALELLFDKNPGRRPIFLQIIGMCENGKPSSEITAEVNTIQKDNQSVYAPMTLCRALERAGALTVDEPDSAETQDDGDAEYLVITQQVDPIWTSTEVGNEVLHSERQGKALGALLEHDGKYLDIYQRVLEFIDQQPRTKKEIDDIVDHDPLVQSPRRYSNHFIELLERTDALIWKNNSWNITDLGKKTLAEMKKGA